MKQVSVAVISAFLFIALTGYALAELRPGVKVMMPRLGWVQAITANFLVSDYEKIKVDADALAAQAKKSAEAATGVSIDASLKLSETALALAGAANKKDGALVATRIGNL
ncbi:MAG: hypothetical protein L7F78_24765, partial [Syntrophales bacterium LBB04]|nr:hypothetical protein [Syntrophales bacterium LBB04]